MEALNPRPAGIKVEQAGGTLVIKRSWYSPQAWFLLFFSLFWDGFLVIWFAGVLQNPKHDGLVVWFPLLHVGVGLFITYLMITTFVNHTAVAVGNGIVSVKHGPLPWPGGKSVSAYDIQQLFCDETFSNTRNGRQAKYRVNAVMKDGRKEVIVAAGIERDQALFIERVAEEQLGIAPAPVVGEIGS